MDSDPDINRRLASAFARLAASFANVAFSARKADEATHDFSDAYEIAAETPNAKRAAEVADATIARAGNTGY